MQTLIEEYIEIENNPRHHRERSRLIAQLLARYPDIAQTSLDHLRSAKTEPSNETHASLCTVDDEHGHPAVATLLVTAITRRVERLCPVTTTEPVAVSDVEAGLTHLLHQGMQQIVLVPWCLQHASTDLIKRAASVLQQVRPGEVDITTMQRPLIPVHGASPMGPLGGLICVQERLDPYITLLPGWGKVYTCLQAEQAYILLLCAFQKHASLQREKDISPLEIALLHELCPDQGERGLPRLDAMLVRDGAIYAGYLVQLLRAVIDTTFLHPMLSRGAAM